VPVNGTHVVTNLQNTVTYTLTVTSRDGHIVRCRATITVTQPPAEPSCTLIANPTTVQRGGSSTLTWTTDNATSASINQGIGSVPLDGSRTVTNLTDTTTYTLTARNSAGDVVRCHVTITVQQPPNHPACTLTANPTTVQQGGSSTLTWTTDNAVSVSISPNIGSVALDGSHSVTNIATTTTYTLTAVGSNGQTVTCNVTIIVQPTVPQQPSCTLTANPTTVQHGGSSTLSWTTQNAASASISPNIGSVGLNGSFTVSNLTNTTTYTLTAVGTNGQTVTCNVTVTVNVAPNLPSCTLTASPSSIQQGGSVTLTWTSQNAVSAHLSPPGQSVGLSGSMTVHPTGNTTYVLTVTDSQGRSATCQAPVTVTPPTQQHPSCTLTANPTLVQLGQDVTLSWTSQNAVSAHLSNVGAVAPNGTLFVRPQSPTTYTLTVTSSTGQTAICQTSVSVVTPFAPPPQIPSTGVPLYQIPYTGFDFGPIGNATYWAALAAFALCGAYLTTYYAPHLYGNVRGTIRRWARGIDGVLAR